jgi:aminoglycoside phosphotransferase (APT) family kinase protein
MTNHPDFLAALERVVATAMPGFEQLSYWNRLSGGASQETWAIDAIVKLKAEPLILRRSPGGGPRVTEGSHAVPLETEALVIEAARAQNVPVPRVRCVLKPEDGAGHGYVMDRLQGETIARKILRDGKFAEVRPKLTRQCGEILARIHAVDTAPMTDILQALDGPAQLRRYRDLYDVYDYPHAVFEFAFQWLEPRLKPAQRLTLVHGDFRLGNLLVSPRGVEAVLDWELTHIGDPLEDLGWLCTRSWRFGLHDKVVGGFGDVEDLVAAYRAAGGADILPEELRIWIAFGSLKWGIMCMTMYRGFLQDGSVERAAIGRRCSETEADLLDLILHGRL